MLLNIVPIFFLVIVLNCVTGSIITHLEWIQVIHQVFQNFRGEGFCSLASSTNRRTEAQGRRATCLIPRGHSEPVSDETRIFLYLSSFGNNRIPRYPPESYEPQLLRPPPLIYRFACFLSQTVEWFDTGEPWSSFLRPRNQVDLLTSGSDDRACSLLVPSLTLLVCEVGVLVFPAS